MKRRKGRTPEQAASTKINSATSQTEKALTTLYVNNKLHELREITGLFGLKSGVHHIGDADTLFRKTLRNYDEIPCLRNISWLRKGLKQPIKAKITQSEFLYGRHALRSPSGQLPVSNHEPRARKRLLRRRPALKPLQSVPKPDSPAPPAEPVHKRSEKELAPTPSETKEPLATEYQQQYQQQHQEQQPESPKSSSASTSSASASTASSTESDTEGYTSRTIMAEEGEAEIQLGEEASDPPTVIEVAPEEPAEAAAPDDTDQLLEIQQLVQEAEEEISAGMMAGEEPDAALAAAADAEPEGGAPEGGAPDGGAPDGGSPEDGAPEGAAEDAGGDAPAGAAPLSGVDSKVLRELEEVEAQARSTANMINELKQRVAELLSKESMTEDEARELDEMNRQLVQYMETFEEKTRQIQRLLAAADRAFECAPCRFPAVQPRHTEDMLPKVIICGTTDTNVPKIIICDTSARRRRRGSPSPPRAPDQSAACPGAPPAPQQPGAGIVPQFARRLNESYQMQEKLAADNVDLEGKRYQLQEELLSRDQTVECLQRKLCGLQAEMRIVVKENAALNEALSKYQEPDAAAGGRCRKPPDAGMPCGAGRGVCPADVENRLQHYSQTTSALEQQVEKMETEVRRMQEDMCTMQRERADAERERRAAAQAAAAAPGCRPTCRGPCRGPGAPGGPPGPSPADAAALGLAEQQFRELREQYSRLQDDFKGKVTEVAALRAEAEALRGAARSAEEARKAAEERAARSERETLQHRDDRDRLLGSKEQLLEQEQQLAVAKQRFRDAQDELEELRALVQDQGAQLEDYRARYLQAQQQVEEQRRQLDKLELEQGRIGEQVQAEIQRVKGQFQERLAELSPLPDILKATQLKLHEEQQVRAMAERNLEQAAREAAALRDRLQQMQGAVERARSDQMVGEDERAALQARASGWECKCSEVQQQAEQLRAEAARAEEAAAAAQRRADEKAHEAAQLAGQLETLREESARQVARTKDRCETVRRTLQGQLADLERQLAQSRAAARAAQKDRDDVRQKMQAQINNLGDNFEEAQLRIRSLQGHVNFLKSSYTNVFGGDPADGAAPDGCDCNNT